MWTGRFWTARFWTGRFWPKVGGTVLSLQLDTGVASYQSMTTATIPYPPLFATGTATYQSVGSLGIAGWGE